MNRPILLSLLLVVMSCAPTPPQSTPTGAGPTAEEAAENRARPYTEGMQALTQYRSEPGCDGPGNAAVAANLADLERMTYQLNLVGGNLAYLAREAKGRHQDLAFGYADTALGKGCLDTADSVYRSLINFYTGAAYSGIRDRARVGIDDVRAKRGG